MHDLITAPTAPSSPTRVALSPFTPPPPHISTKMYATTCSRTAEATCRSRGRQVREQHPRRKRRSTAACARHGDRGLQRMAGHVPAGQGPRRSVRALSKHRAQKRVGSSLATRERTSAEEAQGILTRTEKSRGSERIGTRRTRAEPHNPPPRPPRLSCAAPRPASHTPASAHGSAQRDALEAPVKRSHSHKRSATREEEEAEAESSTAHHKKSAGPPHARHARHATGNGPPPKHQTDVSQERGPAGRKARTAARRENGRSRVRREQRPRSHSSEQAVTGPARPVRRSARGSRVSAGESLLRDTRTTEGRAGLACVVTPGSLLQAHPLASSHRRGHRGHPVGAGGNRRHTRRNAQDRRRGARRRAAEHCTASSRPQPHPTQAPRPSPPPSRRQQRQQQSPQETQQHPHQCASCTTRQLSARIRGSTRCTASSCRVRTTCSSERGTGSGMAWGTLCS